MFHRKNLLLNSPKFRLKKSKPETIDPISTIILLSIKEKTPKPIKAIGNKDHTRKSQIIELMIEKVVQVECKFY